MTTTTHTSSSGVGRVLLWIGLVLSLVVGGMFLAVALTSGGDEQTGGFMIALPAACIAALCAFGLSRSRAAG
jgi:F0F1-type ATP synthase assembly protein I